MEAVLNDLCPGLTSLFFVTYSFLCLSDRTRRTYKTLGNPPMVADLCGLLMHILGSLEIFPHESDMTGHPQEITVGCLTAEKMYSLVILIHVNLMVGLMASCSGYFSLWELSYQQFFPSNFTHILQQEVLKTSTFVAHILLISVSIRRSQIVALNSVVLLF